MKSALSFTVAQPRTGSGATLSVLLAPILLLQARRTARRTPRLDPASGAERGTVPGRGPALRLIVIGESTAAGVGAVRHTEALPGFLAGALRERLRRSVAWSVTGRNGATARRVVTDLVPALNGASPDLVVLTVGINDLIRRRPLKTWTADLTELVASLRGRYGDAELLVAGMPPVHRFPALPQPLRRVMGGRARAMDRIMREVAAANGAIHVPMDPGMADDSRLFASDGLHPSPDGYRLWAHGLAEAVPFTMAPPAMTTVVAAAAAPAPVVTVRFNAEAGWGA
ncbi:SGNH/GDSL hydrolase family protein [Actinomadura sp. 9N407]|uniref:SGNH/GDSL hydrolase family protein n=1 Tax=Actinomadura sp. 9N407 TaxID=3375154 RepID=UPI003797EEE9